MGIVAVATPQGVHHIDAQFVPSPKCEYRATVVNRRGGAITTVALLLAVVVGCTAPGTESTTHSRELLSNKRPTAIPSTGRWSNKQLASIRIATARELDRAGHVREATQLYEAARDADPSLQGVAARLGVLYSNCGDHPRAHAEFRQALKERPGDVNLRSNHGYALLLAGRLDDAHANLLKAVQSDPQNVKARINLAIVCAHQRKFDESYRHFSSSVGKVAAHTNLGIIQLRLGERERARESFVAALQLDPQAREPRAMLKFLEKSSYEATE